MCRRVSGFFVLMLLSTIAAGCAGEGLLIGEEPKTHRAVERNASGGSPPACPPVLCDLACGKFKKDASGCEICACEEVKLCGGWTNESCEANEYCKYEMGSFCGGDDSLGECTKRPEVCPAVEDPVCGCDGMTYGNECLAATSGFSIASHIACDDD